jgi:hypothetical protein
MIERDRTAVDSKSNSHGAFHDTGNNKKLIMVPVGQAVDGKDVPRKRRKMAQKKRADDGRNEADDEPENKEKDE